MAKLKSTYVGRTIQFPKDNMYFYSQDMSYKQSIPNGINFEIIEKLPTKRYMLTANGYGKSNYGKDAYGNGAIFVDEKIIKEIIEMSEPKPYWIASYTTEKNNQESYLPFNPLTINGEPLSTKQLYEIITSQNIFIDKLLINKNNCTNILQDICNCIERGSYNKAKIIIEDTLKNIK